MASGSGLLPGARDDRRVSRALSALTIRNVLVAGFLVTAGIWSFAGYYFSNRISTLESQAAEVSRRYRASQEVLNGTRSQVYRASLSVRDALLDPPERFYRHRSEVENAYQAADRLLASYVPVMESPNERDRAEGLRTEIHVLHGAMLGVLAAAESGTSGDPNTLLRAHGPRRDAAIRVADELHALNRSAFVEQQAATARLYRETQLHFGEVLGLGVLASFAVALLAGLNVSRMERSLREQQEKDARLAADLQRLSARLEQVQEEERRVIARELHDEVGQVLTAVKMELSHAQRETEAGRGGTELLNDARIITDQALRAVREISQLLHPPLLDERGLSAAVDWYLHGVRKRHDLAVEFIHPPMGARLSCDVEVTLYRVIQEGVTNILRHAQATTCRIVLTQSPDRATLSIDDDGIGFSPIALESDAESGLGLLGIRERVTRLGGSLRIETASGRGTILTVELPLEAAGQNLIPPATALAPSEAG